MTQYEGWKTICKLDFGPFFGGPVLYAYGNRAVNLHPFRWNTVALKTVFGLPFGTWHAAPKNDAVEDEFPCSKKWLLASQLFIVWEECFEWLCHAIPTCNSGFQSLSSTSAKKLKVYPFSHPLLLLWIPIRRLESPVTSSVLKKNVCCKKKGRNVKFQATVKGTKNGTRNERAHKTLNSELTFEIHTA